MMAGTFILQDPNSFPDYGIVGVFLPCIHILWGYIMSGGTNNLGKPVWQQKTPSLGPSHTRDEVICVCWCAFFQVSVASDPGRRGQHNMLSPFHSPFQSPFRSPVRSPFRSPFKNFGHPGGRTIDFDCEDDDMNLNCFILMFDLLLKQVVEPEIPLVPRLGPVLEILSIGWASLLSLTWGLREPPKESKNDLCDCLQGHWHVKMDLSFRNTVLVEWKNWILLLSGRSMQTFVAMGII